MCLHKTTPLSGYQQICLVWKIVPQNTTPQCKQPHVDRKRWKIHPDCRRNVFRSQLASYCHYFLLWKTSLCPDGTGMWIKSLHWCVGRWKYRLEICWWQLWQDVTPRAHFENCKLAQTQLRRRRDNGKEARYRGNQTERNSSGSVSSTGTPLSPSADNNAQGWDNRKCQLIRDREREREMERSLFTYTLAEQNTQCPV